MHILCLVPLQLGMRLLLHLVIFRPTLLFLLTASNSHIYLLACIPSTIFWQRIFFVHVGFYTIEYLKMKDMSAKCYHNRFLWKTIGQFLIMTNLLFMICDVPIQALDLGRCANPKGYMVEEIWQELAKAKYLAWEHESTKRSWELRNLK